MNKKTRQSKVNTSDYTDIPTDALWGAQTQHAINHFSIGNDKTPLTIIRSYLVLKKAAALSNQELGVLSGAKTKVMIEAIDALLEMEDDVMKHFPVHIWQSGSGTQTNMNVNEVIANLANQLEEESIHPNDHVNASQSSNDTFPTVLHMATTQMCIHKLMPAVSKLRSSLGKLESRYAMTIKVGRTHMQDALPITYGQMFSAYQTSLSESMNHMHQALDGLFELAIGGTAVGTGFGAPQDFDDNVAQHLSDMWKLPFTPSRNKFSAISSHTALLHFMGCLSNLACTLNKIASDIKLLGSGPRSGIGELLLPENEQGSSMMPGKVNPTQCEALSMVCMQVLGHYQSVAFGCASGHLELNTYKPLIGLNILNSIQLLSDGMLSFEHYCVKGLMVHENQTRLHLERSLMLVTALSKDIGYDKAAEVASLAYTEQLSLKEACLKLEYLSASRLDELLDPSTMIGNSHQLPSDMDY